MNTKVKVGDYIEGYEVTGYREYTSIHKMRLIVDTIREDQQGTVYSGKADDGYGGSRGGCIFETLGEVKVITDEKPFERRWWEDGNNRLDSVTREWNAGDVVKRADGTMYSIIGIGINTDNCGQVVIYRNISGNQQMYSEPRELFEGVNREYNSDQLFKFELVR